jgi:DNA-binding MarR family transcriptional regulator
MKTKEVAQIRAMLQLLVRKFGFLQKEGAQCCGVSPVISHILYEIDKRPGITLNELADTLGLDNSTMSRHIQSLIKQGYVISTQSKEDKRYIALSLTEAGKGTAEEICKLMVCYISDLFQHIPETKRDQVLESIELLLTAIRKSPMCCKAPM